MISPACPPSLFLFLAGDYDCPMQFPEVRLRWSRADSFALVALLTAAAVTRFTNLGYPSREIFDEPVMLALARCYLHKLPYRGNSSAACGTADRT